MNDNEIQKLADFLKALGEFNRLSLVYKLCQCKAPQNAMCLCDCCNVDASVVSRHLKVLTQEGVVKVAKKGRERTYTLDRENVVMNLRNLANAIEKDDRIKTYSNKESL
jgi:ArsR family transcriptional regulator, arsenate/arsenite/antimonite-responsive transcriptional repressor